MRLLRRASCSALLSLCLAAPSAYAGDSEEARALFEQGQALAKSGKVAESCGLYERSHRLAPNACGVIVNLAECTDAIGHSAESFAHYDELNTCAVAQKQTERVQLAKERRAALRKQLVAFDFAAYQSIPGVRLRVDGTDLPRTSLSAPVLLSVRAHTISVDADGCAPESRMFDKLQGGGVVAVPVWPAKCPVAIPTSAAQSAQGVIGNPVQGTTPKTPSDGSGWRTAGLVVGGAGVLSLGVAGVGIISSLGSSNDQKQRVSSTYNTFAGLGLGLVGAGAVMYFALGKDHTTQHSYLVPTGGPQSIGFQAGTSW